MELTVGEAAMFLVLLFAPSLKSLLKSIAFRNRAAGKAEVIRARAGASDGRRASRKRDQ
ncbi:hypothetical protein [Streptomyces sp. NPDC005385]|uniref:hypothetical protein n=1 Tax=Streptomyces sp. NPDC005385 TaxID=3157039 RepID=UPI0033BD62A5